VWLGGILAAAAPTQDNGSVLVLIGGIIIAMMVPLGSVIVEIIKGKNARTTASPPAPLPFPSPPSGEHKDVTLYERTAEHNTRLNHKDQEDHVRDLALKGHADLLDEHGDTLREHDREITRIKKRLGLSDA